MTLVRPSIESDLIEAIYDCVESPGSDRPTTITEALKQVIIQWEKWTTVKEAATDTPEEVLAENETLRRRVKQLKKANENLQDGDASDILELRKIELKEKIHADSMNENKKDRELKTVLKTADALISDRKEKYKILRDVAADTKIDAPGLVEELLGDSAAIKIMRTVPAMIEQGLPLADDEAENGGKQ